MKSTLRATFTLPSIEAYFQQQAQRAEQAILNAYNLAGLEFVREARLKTATEGGFNDITGNLRSSIGYIILKNGKITAEDFQPSDNGTDRETGVAQGLNFANIVASEYGRGIVLICVAGMEYAAAVESKGKDVITGSTLNLTTRLKELLGQI